MYLKSSARYLTACVAVILLACGDNAADRGPQSISDSPQDSFQNSDRHSAQSSDQISDQSAEPVCPEQERFVSEGSLPIKTATAAGDLQLVGMRWSKLEDCERVVLDLSGADERPAPSTGTVRAEYMRTHGIVRIELPNVRSVDSAAFDADFDGSVADRAYAVLSPEGRWIFVDLHLGEAADVYVHTVNDPARIVVDVRPGGEPLPPPAVADDRVVVIRPRAGLVSYPLDVVGYARTFEANVVARLEHGNEQVADTFTTATSWLEAWGYYSMAFEDGPTGPVELHVGEHSARDGTWEGVSLELQAR